MTDLSQASVEELAEQVRPRIIWNADACHYEAVLDDEGVAVLAELSRRANQTDQLREALYRVTCKLREYVGPNHPSVQAGDGALALPQAAAPLPASDLALPLSEGEKP